MLITKKKLSSSLLSVALMHQLLVPVIGVASAYERPSAPTSPSSSYTAPQAPTIPSYYDPTPTPQPTSVPQPTAIPTVSEPTATPTPKVKKTPTPTPYVDAPSNETTDTAVINDPNVETANTNTLPTTVKDESGSTSSRDNMEGDVTVESGDVAGSVNVANKGNTNQASANTPGSSNASIENSENLSDTNNDGVIDMHDEVIIDQSNTANLDNKVNVDLSTGDNKIADNLGGSSKIKTGDANSTVNVINLANTNIAGSNISSTEFDVVDDQSGDIDLSNLASACGSVSGCGGSNNGKITNAKNGKGSDNSGIITSGNNLIITSDNFAEVNNEIDIEVDTGSNSIQDGYGDASIETGDVNIAANIVNFINNNFAGLTDLAIQTINIISDYAGDILLPQGSGGTTNNYAINNGGNGSGSTNNGAITDTNNTNISQENITEITNKITADANTGDNKLTDNIGGDGDTNKIQTGSINSQAGVSNVGSQNFVGDDINVIFYNDKGTMKAYYVNEKGEMVAVDYEVDNTGNGTGSTNNGEIVNENNTTVNQTNEAHVNNNINIDANTGNNKIADNIDGNTSVKTGDVNIITSVANFINNNFAGSRLVITFVNDLFGKWTGNFLTKSTEVEKNVTEESNTSTANVGTPLNNSSTEVDTTTSTVSETKTDDDDSTSTSAAATETATANSEDVVVKVDFNNDSVESTSSISLPSSNVGVLGSVQNKVYAENTTDNDQAADVETQDAQDEESQKSINVISEDIRENGDVSFVGEGLNPWKVSALIGTLGIAAFFMKQRIYG